MIGFVIFWIFCGAVAAAIAHGKGGDAILAFCIGLLLGPFGIIIAFFLGNSQKVEANKLASGDLKKCPRCAELVKAEAVACKHCGHEFPTETPAAA
jgi:O-antigen ligase